MQREVFASLDAALLAHVAPTAVVVNDELRVREIRGNPTKLSVAAVLGRTLKGPIADRIRTLMRQGGGAFQERDLKVAALRLASPEEDPEYCIIFESLALNQELEITRESLSTLVEESEAATEELRCAVEELRSANQELREMNTELTSSSQEVARLNARLEGRAKELERANGELVNLIGGLRMPIVVLGSDLRVKRFTTPAERALGLRPTHIGKRLGEVEGLSALQSDCNIVMTTREPVMRGFTARSGHTLQAMIRPFVSEDQTNAVVIAVMPNSVLSD